MKTLLLALLVFGCLAGVATPARADWVWVNRHHHYNPYARPHFYLGIAPVAVGILSETGPNSYLSSGGGFDLFLGVRANKWFALELGWQPTFHKPEYDQFGQQVDRIGLQALTLDGKFYFVHGPIQPYVTAGVGAYLLGDSLDVFAEGPGFQVGGGVDFWIGPHFSIGLKLQYRGIDMIDVDPNRDDTFISMITGAVDFAVRF